MVHARWALVFCCIFYLLLCLSNDVQTGKLPQTNPLAEIVKDVGADTVSSTIANNNSGATPAINTPQPTRTTTTTNTTTTPTTAKPTEKCNEGFQLVGDQCYHFSETRLHFSEADRQCRNQSAELAHPINLQQHSMLTTYIKANDKYRSTPMWWIGGYRRHSGQSNESMVWKWTLDNSIISYHNWVNSDYRNRSSKNCLQILQHQDYKWIDEDCGFGTNYICQYPLAN